MPETNKGFTSARLTASLQSPSNKMNDHQKIVLKKTEVPDLEFLFLFQLDAEAIYLAAFTPQDPGNKTAYIEKFIYQLI